jgi:hypothetical protein
VGSLQWLLDELVCHVTLICDLFVRTISSSTVPFTAILFLPYLCNLRSTRRYEPEHNIAAHADDESSMRHNAPIFSISWGGPRRFVVKPIIRKGGTRSNGATDADILIRDGDLVVMGGTLQQTHKHEVPPWRKTKDTFIARRRINWTVRSFLETHLMK